MTDGLNPFRLGDRVVLTKEAAASWSRNANRVGTVARQPHRNTPYVSVLWDRLKAQQSYSIEYVDVDEFALGGKCSVADCNRGARHDGMCWQHRHLANGGTWPPGTMRTGLGG